MPPRPVKTARSRKTISRGVLGRTSAGWGNQDGLEMAGNSNHKKLVIFNQLWQAPYSITPGRSKDGRETKN